MKILYISHYAGSPTLGMAFRPWYLAREWVAQGQDVSIVAGSFSHLRQHNPPTVLRDFQKETVDGLNFVWVKTGRYKRNGIARFFSMMRFSVKLWLMAGKIAREERPDLIISSSTYPMDCYGAKRIARLAGDACYLHEVHDMWPDTLVEIGEMAPWHPFVRLVAIAEKAACRKADGIVSLLPYTEEYLRANGLKGGWRWIPNGIPDDFHEETESIPHEHAALFAELRAADKFIVLYFGGHAISNALDLLLDTAKLNQDPSIVFVLVGDGTEKKALMERAQREHIPRIYFLKPVAKRSIPDLLSRADLCFFGGKDSTLYRYGSSLNKVHDCMGAGIPILYAIPEQKPLIAQVACGLVAEKANPQAVLEKLNQLRRLDREQLREMGLRGQKYVMQHLLYSGLSRDFLDFAEKIRSVKHPALHQEIEP